MEYGIANNREQPTGNIFEKRQQHIFETYNIYLSMTTTATTTTAATTTTNTIYIYIHIYLEKAIHVRKRQHTFKHTTYIR